MRLICLIGALILSCSSETAPAPAAERAALSASPHVASLAELRPYILGSVFRGPELDVVAFKDRLVTGAVDPIVVIVATDVRSDDDLQLSRLAAATGVPTLRLVIADEADFGLRAAQLSQTSTLIIETPEELLSGGTLPASGTYLFADGGKTVWYAAEGEWKPRIRELRSVIEAISKVMEPKHARELPAPDRVPARAVDSNREDDVLPKVQTKQPDVAPPKKPAGDAAGSNTNRPKPQKIDKPAPPSPVPPLPALPAGPLETSKLLGMAKNLAGGTSRSERLSTVVAPSAGRGVLVNIWATWCIPCVKEMPTITALAHEYRDTVRYVGLLTESNDIEVRTRLDKICSDGLRNHQYSLGDARVIAQLLPARRGQGLEETAVPIFALFDHKGRLVLTLTETIAAPASERKLRTALEALASEGGDRGPQP